LTEEETKPRLAPTDGLEEEMAIIKCVQCGHERGVAISPSLWQGIELNEDVLQAVLVCKYPVGDPTFERGQGVPCNGRTVFELTGNAITFAPGKLFERDLSRRVTTEVAGLFNEAVSCFYSRAYKSTLGMCRSAFEQVLDEKNVKGRDLFKKTAEALEVGMIDPPKKTLIDGTRLGAAEALHHLGDVSQAQALTIMNVTIEVVNHIAAQEPLPASQS